jgi:hypothetical protein
VPYTSLNGHMFSYLSKEGKLALRLPAGEREAFLLKKYKARLYEAYGIVQAEYVEVPDSLHSSTRELKKYFDCSYAYVGSLNLSRSPPRERRSLTSQSGWLYVAALHGRSVEMSLDAAGRGPAPRKPARTGVDQATD